MVHRDREEFLGFVAGAIHIAMCGNAHVDDGDIKAIIAKCAQEAGYDKAEINVFDSTIDMIENIVHPADQKLFDLVICGPDMQGMSLLNVFNDLSEAEFVPSMIAFSRDESTAYESLEAGISEFLVIPVSAEVFAAVMQRQVVVLSNAEGEYIVIRDSGKMRKIALSRIVHIETAGHDQLLHLTNGDTAKTRRSSNDMFELVSHDERFFKVGSSNIINLDRIMFTREGNKDIHMEDGSVIVAPVRIRKALEETLLSRAM